LIKFLRSLFLLSTVALIFISCNQTPTSVGVDLIADKSQIDFKQLDSYDANLTQRSSYYYELNYAGTAEYVMLGKIPYMESSILYHWDFTLADSIKTAFTDGSLRITSAWIQMRPRYTIGDSNSNFDFSVYQVRNGWTSTTFTKDSVAQLLYDAYDVKSNLTYDSVYKFNVNTSVIKEWFKYIIDTTTTPKNYGLLFKPKQSVSKICGFYSADVTLDTSETLIHFVIEKPSTGYIDTISVSPDQDVHIVTHSTAPTTGTNIYLEGTLPYRSKLFFDLSSLPKDIIVSNATLELTVDSTKSLDGSLTSDSIYVQTLADSASTKLTKDSSYYAILKRSGNKYSGDMAWMVQKWIRSDLYYANQGISIALTDEINSCARIAIYGSSDSKKERRPRLKITYMQKQ
jgi:hypothetical protein